MISTFSFNRYGSSLDFGTATLLQGDSPCTPLVLIRLGLKSQTNEPTTKRGFTMEQKKMIEALGY